VWTGGFGTMGDPHLLNNCLSLHAKTSFDVCNMHPFLWPQGDVDFDTFRLQVRLAYTRQVLDEACAGQPLRASGFGVPTTAGGRPPAGMGLYYKAPADRARLIPEEEALAWWTRSLRVLAETGFEVVCLLARDWRDDLNRGQNHSGLLRRDGQDKLFLPALLEALPEITKQGEGE